VRCNRAAHACKFRRQSHPESHRLTRGDVDDTADVKKPRRDVALQSDGALAWGARGPEFTSGRDASVVITVHENETERCSD
jgi:hypothetical protein